MGWWVALCDDGTTTNTSKGGGTWESGAFIFIGGRLTRKKNCGILTVFDMNAKELESGAVRMKVFKEVGVAAPCLCLLK